MMIELFFTHLILKVMTFAKINMLKSLRERNSEHIRSGFTAYLLTMLHGETSHAIEIPAIKVSNIWIHTIWTVTVNDEGKVCFDWNTSGEYDPYSFEMGDLNDITPEGVIKLWEHVACSAIFPKR